MLTLHEWEFSDDIIQEPTQITVGVQRFAAGLELSNAFFSHHWESIAILVSLVMTFGKCTFIEADNSVREQLKESVDFFLRNLGATMEFPFLSSTSAFASSCGFPQENLLRNGSSSLVSYNTFLASS